METLNAELFKIEYPDRAIVRDKSFANDAGYRIDEKTEDYWMNNVVGDAGRSTSWIVYFRFQNNVTFKDYDLVNLLVDDLLIKNKTITFFENWYHVTFDPQDDPENEGELLSAFRFIKAIRDAVNPIYVEKADTVQKKHIRLQGSAKLKDDDIDSRKLDSIPKIGEVIDGFEVVKVFYRDDSDIDLFGNGDVVGVVLVNFESIEWCNYARAKEIADSLSAELLPISKYPFLINVIREKQGIEIGEVMWGDSEDADENICYRINENQQREYLWLNKSESAIAIPCRILIMDKYLTKYYHQHGERTINFSQANQTSKMFIGDVTNVRVSLMRNEDYVIVASVDITLGGYGRALIISNTVGASKIEYTVKFEHRDNVMTEPGYLMWIDSISLSGALNLSEDDYELIVSEI